MHIDLLGSESYEFVTVIIPTHWLKNCLVNSFPLIQNANEVMIDIYLGIKPRFHFWYRLDYFFQLIKLAGCQSTFGDDMSRHVRYFQ